MGRRRDIVAKSERTIRKVEFRFISASRLKQRRNKLKGEKQHSDKKRTGGLKQLRFEEGTVGRKRLNTGEANNDSLKQAQHTRTEQD